MFLYDWYVIREFYSDDECDKLYDICQNQQSQILRDSPAAGKNVLTSVIEMDRFNSTLDKMFRMVHDVNKNYYGFDKLPRTKDKKGNLVYGSIENTSKNTEIAGDINNSDELEQLEEPQIQEQPKENVVAQSAQQNNPGAQTTSDTKPSTENTAAPKEETPPTYKIEVSDSGDGWTGKVYANGNLIQTQEFITNYSTYGEDGKTKYTGQAGVKEYLRFKSKIMGWYGSDGKQYPKSNNVS